MTRVLIAPDKFKGTLAASGVAASIAAGWRRADPRARIDELPVADGGEGTLEALVDALGGEIRRERVTGPLGDPVEAEYGLVRTPEGLQGVIEMARASGLALVSEPRRDVRRATTRGTGELIAAAIRAGATRVLVTIGGSATNDAGAGMAQALGIRLLDVDGRDLPPGGAALDRLAAIDLGGLEPAVAKAEMLVACDVDNPLTGPSGASAVFGPQKGATTEVVAQLDRCLGRFASVTERDLGLAVRDLPGAGAAGGLGAGLVAFLGAKLRPGFDLVADVLGLEARVRATDVVVTGEGRFDRGSLHGKAPTGVLSMARAAAKRTALVAGQVEDGVAPPADEVVDLAARFGLAPAMERTRAVLDEAGEELARRFG